MRRLGSILALLAFLVGGTPRLVSACASASAATCCCCCPPGACICACAAPRPARPSPVGACATLERAEASPAPVSHLDVSAQGLLLPVLPLSSRLSFSGTPVLRFLPDSPGWDPGGSGFPLPLRL